MNRIFLISVWLLIVTLMEAIKPVVAVKNQFEQRDKLIMKSFFRLLRTLGLVMQKTKQPIFQGRTFLEVNRF